MKGIILQNTIKYSDNVLCLLNLCQISNWHNISVRFVIFLRMRRYILKCAILSTYGQSNNNYKQFRSKLGSNSFIWYITTINKIMFVADGYMMNVNLRQFASRVNAILGYPCVMVRNGYFIPIFFLLTSGIVFRTLLGLRKSWSG